MIPHFDDLRIVFPDASENQESSLYRDSNKPWNKDPKKQARIQWTVGPGFFVAHVLHILWVIRSEKPYHSEALFSRDNASPFMWNLYEIYIE